MNNKTNYIWGLLRLGLGWIFLWAFIDKLFGFGFETAPENAWLVGGSPTAGFLKFATKGPLMELYHNLAGSPAVDWLFMLGILFIGVTLVLGVVVRLGASVGIIMLILMYTAGFMPPVHNPFVDEHIIYIIIMFGIIISEAGDFLGLGRWWSNIGLVQRFKFLK